MEKLIEEVQQTVKVITYKAIDGTIFDTEEECRRYENTAKCALLTRYNKLVLKESNEYSLFGFGCDEDCIDVVKIKNSDDVTLIMQLYFHFNPHVQGNEQYEDRIKKYTSLCTKALDVDDLLFIGRGYNRESFYIEGTRNQHIEALQNLCKE